MYTSSALAFSSLALLRFRIISYSPSDDAPLYCAGTSKYIENFPSPSVFFCPTVRISPSFAALPPFFSTSIVSSESFFSDTPLTVTPAPLTSTLSMFSAAADAVAVSASEHNIGKQILPFLFILISPFSQHESLSQKTINYCFFLSFVSFLYFVVSLYKEKENTCSLYTNYTTPIDQSQV